jgi:3-oxosteroid 1-dehydrogenase
MSKKNNKSVGRRQVLKGALAGAALTGATSLLTNHATAAASGSARWDQEVDVVLVGSGSGLVGAMVAAKAGKRVLVLEKYSAPGGNTGVSGGIAWVPNNRVMTREGLSDSREQAKVYLTQLAQGQASEYLIDAFLDNGPDMLEFIEQNTSIKWRVSKLLGDVADYHPTWQGSNVKGRSVEPEQPNVAMAGGLLVSSMLQMLLSHGGELKTGATAQRLITEKNESGATKVVGVQVQEGNSTLRIRARDGVLIAAGGFERNDEMKKHYLRGPCPYTMGAESNTGDGIRMGMAVGADLRNMNEVWGITVYKAEADEFGHRRAGISLNAQIERRNAGGISVNRYGERFCNEAADYDSSWRSFHTWENWGELGYRNLPAYQIFDQTVREKYTIAGKTGTEELPKWVVSADTLPDLAKKMGIDVDGLSGTVKRFNQFAKAGVDKDFHRGESPYDVYGSSDRSVTLKALEKPPFYGVEISAADLGTCGGLRVNNNAQVLDVFGDEIVGLYASGNSSGVGAPGAMYGGGGGTIGPALTFAFIAGKHMAQHS